MARFRSPRRILPALLILAALRAAAPSFAQTPAPVSGIVTNASGQALEGATVSSGTGSRPDTTTSGTDGRFQLANSTNVLHAALDGYQPITLLINPPVRDLRIQLQPIALSSLTGVLVVPVCAPIPHNDRSVDRLGAGDLGLQFTVPRKGWDLRQLGQGDLHEYVLTPRHSHAQLTLWFGANAVQLTPSDRFFLESSSFAQRAVVIAGPGPSAPVRSIGIDSSGTFADGGLWRHLATTGSEATYDHATPSDAVLFDGIIGSLCIAPGA